MRDPLQASQWETDRSEFVGLSLKEAKTKLKAAKLQPNVVWTDGKWDETIRTSELRPKEVKLVVQNNTVLRAYQIL